METCSCEKRLSIVDARQSDRAECSRGPGAAVVGPVVDGVPEHHLQDGGAGGGPCWGARRGSRGRGGKWGASRWGGGGAVLSDEGHSHPAIPSVVRDVGHGERGVDWEGRWAQGGGGIPAGPQLLRMGDHSDSKIFSFVVRPSWLTPPPTIGLPTKNINRPELTMWLCPAFRHGTGGAAHHYPQRTKEKGLLLHEP